MLFFSPKKLFSREQFGAFVKCLARQCPSETVGPKVYMHYTKKFLASWNQYVSSSNAKELELISIQLANTIRKKIWSTEKYVCFASIFGLTVFFDCFRVNRQELIVVDI